MSYMSKRMRFRNAIEVYEYHTAKYGAKGQERKPKRKATPEQVKKQNQYQREKMARWKLRNNFDVDDYFSRLSYEMDKRPASMEEAKKDWKAFLQILRREYKKRGVELKWMRNIEVGTRGAWHIHIIVNRIPDTDIILHKAWPHGQTRNQLLYEKGEFAELAKYITKTPETEKRLKETSYSASRNLPIPEPDEHVHKHWDTWGKIRIPKGWYVDPDSVQEDINDVTGYPYRSYTLFRTKRLPREEKKSPKKKKVKSKKTRKKRDKP